MTRKEASGSMIRIHDLGAQIITVHSFTGSEGMILFQMCLISPFPSCSPIQDLVQNSVQAEIYKLRKEVAGQANIAAISEHGFTACTTLQFYTFMMTPRSTIPCKLCSLKPKHSQGWSSAIWKFPCDVWCHCWESRKASTNLLWGI